MMAIYKIMKSILSYLAALFIMLVSGCSILFPGAGLDDFPLADIESISSKRILQQKITLSFDEKEIALIGVIEQRVGGIKIVGLTDFGKRLLFIDYDGEKVNTELEPMLAEYFSGRDILLHYQMAFWSQGKLQQAISASDWELISNIDFGKRKDSGKAVSKAVREFYYHGDLAYRVDLEKSGSQVASAKVCNTELGYWLRFESL
ncbi:MAG: DUF3261 domain-containing protein [Gammaproteobacteria bacterium]|nr:MAG: DUF3261 domain-containing protein [Gammaproteobacteria bacterium]